MDGSPVYIPDWGFAMLIELFRYLYSIAHYKLIGRIERFIYGILIHRVQYKYLDRTRSITKTRFRECSIPQDQIYGVMTASGVVIPPYMNLPVEEVRRIWWQEAIKRQHAHWACSAIVWEDAGVPPSYPRYNCAMPPFDARQIASTVLHMGIIEPLGPTSLEEETLCIYGYDVGACELVSHLGPFYHRLKDNVPIRQLFITYILGRRILTLLHSGSLRPLVLDTSKSGSCT